MAKRFRDVLVLLAVGGLAMGLLAACAGDGDEGASAQELDRLQARIQQLEEQLQATEKPAGPAVGPTIMVKPAFFKFPVGRVREPGAIWFYGSGLEPGQWFRISIEAEGEDGDVTFAPEDLRQANASGAFAFTPPEIRPDRWAIRDVFGQRGGVFNVKLWDMDTDTLLALTPLVVCGSDGENPWCEPEEVVAEPGAGTVWTVDQIVLEDGRIQLRMASQSYWGYGAGERPYADEVGGIVMTVKVGDTIKFDRIRQSGGRSTTAHHFTIEGLGIDFNLDDGRFGSDPPGGPQEPFEIKLETAGEFIIDDSSDPGSHGSAKIVVEE